MFAELHATLIIWKLVYHTDLVTDFFPGFVNAPVKQLCRTGHWSATLSTNSLLLYSSKDLTVTCCCKVFRVARVTSLLTTCCIWHARLRLAAGILLNALKAVRYSDRLMHLMAWFLVARASTGWTNSLPGWCSTRNHSQAPLHILPWCAGGLEVEAWSGRGQRRWENHHFLHINPFVIHLLNKWIYSPST